MDIEIPFRQYRDDVFRLALSYTRSYQEAEDVCQTAYIRLLEAQNVTPGKERAWLMQVTANLCRNLLRSAWWRSAAPMEEAPLFPEPVRHPEVYEAVMALPPKYRVVIFLHYYEELTTGEIAGLLRISRTAVTTRLSRARKLLCQALKEDEL